MGIKHYQEGRVAAIYRIGPTTIIEVNRKDSVGVVYLNFGLGFIYLCFSSSLLSAHAVTVTLQTHKYPRFDISIVFA